MATTRTTAPVPPHLIEIAGILRSPSPAREDRGFGVRGGEWTVRPPFRGYADPSPPKTHCFGKERSCLRDRQGRMSCAEIEIVRRLRSSGWCAGWISPYSGDPPIRWARWTWTQADAAAVVPPGYARFRGWLEAQPTSDGIPDVVATNGVVLVVIECKRQPIQGSRDTPRSSQTRWVSAVLAGRRPLLPDSCFVVAYWERRPAPRTPPRVPPELEPTRKYPAGRPLDA